MTMSNKALLIIDVINDFQFEYGDQLLQHTQNIITPLLQLKKRAKQQHIPIIYINDHYNLWQADFKKSLTIVEQTETPTT